MRYMKRSRTVAVLLALMLAVLAAPLGVFAEGEAGIELEVSAANTSLKKGDLLSVGLRFVSAVADFGGAQFSLEYDSEKLEFVSYTALLGGEDEDSGMTNQSHLASAGKLNLLLLNSDSIISGKDTSIAAGTSIGNVVFRVTGNANEAATLGIAKAGFSAHQSDDDITALTAAEGTFAVQTVNIVETAEYPTENAPNIYCITTEADGIVTLQLRSSGLAKVTMLDIYLSLEGYADIMADESCPFYVSVTGSTVSITYSSDEGVDMSSGIAVLTMTKAEGEQSITATPTAIAGTDKNGVLSPITKPNVVDDPYGGYELGDVDVNGTVTVNDAVLALKKSIDSVTLTAQQVLLADADGNGVITVNDAVMILKKAIGLADF